MRFSFFLFLFIKILKDSIHFIPQLFDFPLKFSYYVLKIDILFFIDCEIPFLTIFLLLDCYIADNFLFKGCQAVDKILFGVIFNPANMASHFWYFVIHFPVFRFGSLSIFGETYIHLFEVFCNFVIKLIEEHATPLSFSLNFRVQRFLNLLDLLTHLEYFEILLGENCIHFEKHLIQFLSIDWDLEEVIDYGASERAMMTVTISDFLFHCRIIERSI